MSQRKRMSAKQAQAVLMDPKTIRMAEVMNVLPAKPVQVLLAHVIKERDALRRTLATLTKEATV